MAQVISKKNTNNDISLPKRNENNTINKKICVFEKNKTILMSYKYV